MDDDTSADEPNVWAEQLHLLAHRYLGATITLNLAISYQVELQILVGAFAESEAVPAPAVQCYAVPGVPYRERPGLRVRIFGTQEFADVWVARGLHEAGSVAW